MISCGYCGRVNKITLAGVTGNAAHPTLFAIVISYRIIVL
jgi:hypothetical protein